MAMARSYVRLCYSSILGKPEEGKWTTTAVATVWEEFLNFHEGLETGVTDIAYRAQKVSVELSENSRTRSEGISFEQFSGLRILQTRRLSSGGMAQFSFRVVALVQIATRHVCCFFLECERLEAHSRLFDYTNPHQSCIIVALNFLAPRRLGLVGTFVGYGNRLGILLCATSSCGHRPRLFSSGRRYT